MPTPDFRVAGLLFLIVVLSSCRDELYHGLDERDANEMVVALEQSGVDASKTPDPRDPNRWMVQVPTGAHVDAMHALEARGLPRPTIDGFSAFYPSEGLVPTSSEEHVLLQYATAQELRRSLIAVDGVVDAHVNLVLPDSRRRLSSEPPRPARASVVVKYDGSDEAPLGVESVRKILSGGVDGLEPEAIEVLLTASRSTVEPLAEPRLVQVGPIAVPAAGSTVARVVFGVMTSLILGLAAALVTVLLRRRRT